MDRRYAKVHDGMDWTQVPTPARFARELPRKREAVELTSFTPRLGAGRRPFGRHT